MRDHRRHTHGRHFLIDREGDPLNLALSELEEGQCGVVRKLRGGRTFVSRMAALGFTIGAEVTVIQNRHRGPLIVMVRATRVALGRGEARRVKVERHPHEG